MDKTQPSVVTEAVTADAAPPDPADPNSTAQRTGGWFVRIVPVNMIACVRCRTALDQSRTRDLRAHLAKCHATLSRARREELIHILARIRAVMGPRVTPAALPQGQYAPCDVLGPVREGFRCLSCRHVYGDKAYARYHRKRIHPDEPLDSWEQPVLCQRLWEHGIHLEVTEGALEMEVVPL